MGQGPEGAALRRALIGPTGAALRRAPGVSLEPAGAVLRRALVGALSQSLIAPCWGALYKGLSA